VRERPGLQRSSAERLDAERLVADRPNVYAVARRAGVSTATVSRVLAGRERVLPDTRDKVLTAIAELGYVPSGAAKDLAARRTGVLGLCFPDLVVDQDIVQNDSGYWYDEVIRGMERSARRRGYAVLIAASHHSDDGRLVLSIAGRCDGLREPVRRVPPGPGRPPGGGQARLSQRLHHRGRPPGRRADHRHRAGAAGPGVRERPDRDRSHGGAAAGGPERTG
jgi:hypothetical protein